MKVLIYLLGIAAILSACGENGSAQNEKNGHEVTVQEVIQVSGYTYLRVEENDSTKWLAVGKMAGTKIGDVFYYKDGFEMKNFESKELDRTFESIFFLDFISKEPLTENTKVDDVNPHGNMTGNNNMHGNNNQKKPGKPDITKKEISVTPVNEGITIAELFANKEKYSGKVVKIKGEVTKYNAAIMNKNWVHLQDGTDHEGKFDLTVTTAGVASVGEVVTFEGKIALDKDFGFGYFYDVLMEDAVKK